MNGASSNDAGSTAHRNDGAAQSNGSSSMPSSRTTGIRRGFLNNTAARRLQGRAQTSATQQTGAHGIQPLLGATPVTQPSTQAAADETSNASVSDSAQSAAAARPNRAAGASPLAAAARSMWGSGASSQSTSPTPATTASPSVNGLIPGQFLYNPTAIQTLWGSGASRQAWSNYTAPAEAALAASRAAAWPASDTEESDDDNEDRISSMRRGFDRMRPRAKPATREAFFAKYAANRARNATGRAPSPPPPSQHPREERQTRAQLLPADHNVYLELMTGIRVPTAHFTLPFTAADGRQTLVAMPGDVVPSYRPGIVEMGLDLWDFWGLEAPEDPQEPRPYMPYQPLFTPARAGQPAMFFDELSQFLWPLVPAAASNVPNWDNSRNAHYVVAAPPYSASWLNRDNVTEAFPGFSVNQGSAQTAQDAKEYTARIKRFLDGLETADAELRLRMTRLGIGEVGDGDGSEGDVRGPGCAICLEVFGKESDRPEWMGGAEVHERRVIVSPCSGFHIYHRGCLRQALAAVMTWRKWSCPLCRAPLRDEAAKRVEAAERGASASSSSTSTKGKSSKSETKAMTSLREEVHRREKEKGYVCDYPACYPNYNTSPSAHAAERNGSVKGEEGVPACLLDQVDRRLITLTPCGHRVHHECLTTTLPAERRKALEESAEEDYDDDDANGSGGGESESSGASGLGEGNAATAIREVGRWVECPVDKGDVWAMIPVLKRGKPAERQGSADSGGSGSGSTSGSNQDEGVVVVVDKGTAEAKKEGKGKAKA